jgi:hypothetical protein
VLGSALAFLPWTIPAATALAVAAMLGPFLALPLALVAALAVVLLQTLGELGPAAPALTLAARGHWLAGEPVFRGCLPSLLAVLAAMIGAMAIRARFRR